jgi:hypothetical protein
LVTDRQSVIIIPALTKNLSFACYGSFNIHSHGAVNIVATNMEHLMKKKAKKKTAKKKTATKKKAKRKAARRPAARRKVARRSKPKASVRMMSSRKVTPIRL